MLLGAGRWGKATSRAAGDQVLKEDKASNPDYNPSDLTICQRAGPHLGLKETPEKYERAAAPATQSACGGPPRHLHGGNRLPSGDNHQAHRPEGIHPPICTQWERVYTGSDMELLGREEMVPLNNTEARRGRAG